MTLQNSALVFTDGEKLRILIDRDGRSVVEIAHELGISRQRLIRYTKQSTLEPEVKTRISEALGIPESFFDPRLNPDALLRALEDLQDNVTTLNRRVQSLEAKNNGLEEAIKILNAPDRKKGGN